MSAKRFRPPKPEAAPSSPPMREPLRYYIDESQLRGLQREVSASIQRLSNVQQFLSELAAAADRPVAAPPKPDGNAE